MSRGSPLFECICNLDKYHIQRTEISIMENHIDEIAELNRPVVLLIEFGSGDCTRTRILLNHLSEIAAYVPKRAHA